MVSSFLDLEKNIKSLDGLSLNLTSDLGTLTSGFKDLTKAANSSGSVLDKQGQSMKGLVKSSDEAAKGFSRLGLAASGAFKTLLGAVAVGGTIASIVTIANAGTTAFKEFSSVSKTLTFSEAITGSTSLAENLKFLEQTADKTFGAIALGLQVFTDNKGFNEFSSKAVKAFADVEEAAFRLSTITVSGNERSIDALDRNIEAMKSLQRETNFALDSVTLLNAQYDIASAGFTDPTANLQVGEAAINLSQAGFGDLQGSTNAVVRVLSALGESADQAEKRAAQLFETTKVGLLTLDQLAGNVGSLSSQAKQLGVSFEEVNTSLAVLTTQGISADEAATRLASFLADVVNVSPEAAKALAQFRDEAGKPIQLNATSLREKGIQGVLKDLETATGGSLSKIQDIFTNQTSQEFVSLSLGAGEERFTEFRDRIDNADPTALSEEAAGRNETLKGGFTSAFNRSQAEVTNFGSAFSESVIKQLEDSNTLIGAFSTGSAEALGGFLGKLNAIQSQLSAVGGFLASAFSAVAPIAFFGIVVKGFSTIGAKINSIKQQGETVFQAIKRVALETVDRIENRLIDAISKALRRLEQFKSELNEVGAGNRPGVSRTSFVSETIGSGVGSGLRGGIETANKGVEGLKKNAGSLAKGSLSLVGDVALSSGKLLAGFAVGGGLAIGAMTALSGWADALYKNFNQSLIPELQTMKQTLESLNDVEGLDNFLSEFDEFTGKVESSNLALNVYAESVDRLKGLFNNITGKGLTNLTVQENLAEGQSIVQADTQTALVDAEAGRLDKDQIDEAIKANKTRIQLAEQAVASERANGGGDPAALENLQSQLKLTKSLVEEENKRFEEAKNLSEFKEKIEGFKNIDTSIPINIQIATNSERAIQSQIDSIAKDFNEAFSATGVNTEELSQKLGSIVPRISQAFQAIETQIELDPNGAAKLRQSLEQQLGPNLARYLANDPNLRNAYNSLFEQETTARVTQAQTVETGQTSVLDSAQQLGLENATVAGAKFEAQTNSINAQVAALNEELSKPTTSLQRQIELTAQIEQLEAKRAGLAADTRIKEELSAKKQIQSLDQQLLSIEQAKVNLFSQQNEFNLFSVSLARAKVVEAKKALQVAQQQTAIETRESVIRKEEAVNAIQNRGERLEGQAQGFSTSAKSLADTLDIKAPSSSTTSPIKVDPSGITNSIQSNLKSQLENIDKTRQTGLEQTDKQANTFSPDEQARIAETISKLTSEFNTGASKFLNDAVGFGATENTRENLFNGDGTLKIPVEDLQKVLNSRTENNSENNNFLTGRALSREDIARTTDIFTDKRKLAVTGRNEVETKAEADKNTAQETAKGAAESNVDSLNNQARQQAASQQAAKDNQEVLASAQKELAFAQILSDVTNSFSNLDKVIALNIAQVELEFASREKIVAANEAIGEATQAIGNTLGSLSGSISGLESIGTDLQGIGLEASNPGENILLDRDKALRQIETTVKTTEDVFNKADNALKAAVTLGADPATLNRLRQTRNEAENSLDTAQGEAEVDTQRVEEETNLKIINSNLQLFANRVDTVNKGLEELKNKLSKQVDLFKNALDFSQRLKDNAAENNNSRASLQTSILGFFSKNNPGATALSQRIEVGQIENETKQQQSQAVTDAKKEVLDLQLQKSQLELEAKGFDNALTQTQILADILAVSQGGEAVNTTTDEAQKRIAEIPNVIKQNQTINQAQRGLIDRQLEFIPRSLQDQLTRISAEGTTRRLDALGGTFNPMNADLAARAITDAQQGIRELPREDFSVGSLQDREFRTMMEGYSNLSNGGGFETRINELIQVPQNQELVQMNRQMQESNRKDSYRLNQDSVSNLRSSGSNGGGSSFNQTINLQLTVSGGSGNSQNDQRLQEDIRKTVKAAVSDANKQLSQDVLRYAQTL